jgi:hypothetical protein
MNARGQGGGSKQPRRRRRRRRQRRKGGRDTRLVVRMHPERQAELFIVLGVAGLLLVLALTGASEDVLILLGIVAAFFFLVLGITRGAPAQYKIVEEQLVHSSEATSSSARFEETESSHVPGAASGELRHAIGDPLATELHDLERQLLEEAANGRLPAKDVARLAQELAQNRAELIEKGTPDTGGSATGQPHSNQTGH